MRAVILAPHHDDVALFTAFNAIRHQAQVIVCLKSVKQQRDGITDAVRFGEEWRAARALELPAPEFWQHPDVDPDWDAISADIAAIDADLIFAPAVEAHGGNAQHNEIGTQALRHHRDKVARYLTYTTAGKSTWGTPVKFELAWVPMKLRALACHVSQATHPLCYPHFLRDQTEYVA